MVKLDSGVHSGESPVNGCSGLVSFCLQGREKFYAKPSTYTILYTSRRAGVPLRSDHAD